jgi:hypothetical protein
MMVDKRGMHKDARVGKKKQMQGTGKNRKP